VDQRPRLESWKEIAVYFGRSVSTVQRWERTEKLPVHRHEHARQGSVYACREELDAWRARRRPGHRRYAAWAVAALVLVTLAGLVAARWPVSHAPVLPMVPLTSYPGREIYPSLSPDGSQVVFTWEQPRGDFDLFVRPVAGGEPRRLTSGPAQDLYARWAPDGRWIAFVRRTHESAELLVIAPDGSGGRRLASLRPPAWIDPSVGLAWSPDGKRVIFPNDRPFAIFETPLEGDGRRRLTAPPAGIHGDVAAAYSPDGRHLAFVRYRSGSEADIYVAPAAGGNARRLSFDERRIYGLAWTRDSRGIVFGSAGGGLERLRIDNGSRSLALTGGGPAGGPLRPAIAGDRLVVQVETIDMNLRLWRPPALPVVLAPSTLQDDSAALSPDGAQVAFSSGRSGHREIWIADCQAGRVRQLTSFRGPYTDAPRWSPDSSKIAFTSHLQGNRDIFVIPSAGGVPARLTTEPSDEGRASWSRDGRWIYFRSNRSGSRQIWKMPAGGGPARQVTTKDGYEAFESLDGRLLYYTKEREQLGLWSVPVEGGLETRVIEGVVREGRWAVAAAGIYFVDHRTPGVAIRFFDFAARRISEVHRIGAIALYSGFSVTPDGHALVWSQREQHEADLMMVEGFR